MNIFGVTAIGMKADEARVKVISQNIANALTPGYKAQIASTAVLRPQFDAIVNTLSSMSTGMVLGIDAHAGALRATGNYNDVAIEGDAFFELDSPTGPLYTRQGALRVDINGKLVGAQGLPLSGLGGGGVNLANAPFAITARGDVVQSGRTVGTLKLVSFEQPSKLEPLGDGTYAQGAARPTRQTAEAHVRTGFSEASNVNSTQEMVRLTETVRHFEAMNKVVQGYDEALEQTMKKLGEF
jgi:flagellar basal-body rod protein FlgF